MAIGTFGSFTQARLAIYASQTGLSVTGNNIANINTDGYCRQKLDQSSFYAGGSDRYYSTNEKRVGNGVLVTGISQFRDPYLDIRFRNENASVGALDAKLTGLEDIQRILDEVGDGKDGFGVLGAQLGEFAKQLEHLSEQTGHAEYDIQVRSAAEALTKLFNSYASQLKQVQKNAEKDIVTDVDKINNILTSIRDLNAEIRKAEIHGDNALELQDQRNLLIDELSGYMKIDVVPKEVDLGGIKINELTISLGDSQTLLVDGRYATQLELGDAEHNFDVTLAPLKNAKGETYTETKGGVTTTSTAITLGDNDLYGSLQAQREFLTEAGEFATPEMIAADPDAATKRGLPYYQKSLDLLARQFANIFNEANQGYLHNEKGEYITPTAQPDGTIVDKPIEFAGERLSTKGLSQKQLEALKTSEYALKDAGGNLILDKNNQPQLDLDKFMKDEGVAKVGFPMFTSEGGTDETGGITASNITISAAWAAGGTLVNSYLKPTDLPVGSTDSSNILHMITLLDTKMEYKSSTLENGTPDPGEDPYFIGTFHEMWNNIGTVLGNDMMSTSTLLDTYYASAVQLDTGRDSVSSVDLNDEAMNLMQYSKSYNAACRLMTTLDSVLDKLINGTGMIT